MTSSLKTRLRLLRELSGGRGGERAAGSGERAPGAARADFPPGGGQDPEKRGQDSTAPFPAAPPAAVPFPPPLAEAGWEAAGHLAAKRRVSRPFSLPREFPPGLRFLIPDLYRYLENPESTGKIVPEDLLFFDLETTGLSTAAGTLAFLAAFGRPVPSAGGGIPENFPEKASWRLEITQYLLLDFPGESVFLEAVLPEFAALPGGRPPLLVSYNGKSFDLPILRNRSLMAGMRLPEPCHADLLHPARRLWKRVLPSCSQRSVEVEVLGLDRSGDVPGSEAPDIWFGFLKSGETGKLSGVCDHNLRDIFGLASLWACFGEIAARPLDGAERYRCDIERLALEWRKRLLLENRNGGGRPDSGEEEAGETLLEKAAREGWPQAAKIRAIQAEWRGRDPEKALDYVRKALARPGTAGAVREALLCRLERLLRKTGGVQHTQPAGAPGGQGRRHCPVCTASR